MIYLAHVSLQKFAIQIVAVRAIACIQVFLQRDSGRSRHPLNTIEQTPPPAPSPSPPRHPDARTRAPPPAPAPAGTRSFAVLHTGAYPASNKRSHPSPTTPRESPAAPAYTRSIQTASRSPELPAPESLPFPPPGRPQTSLPHAPPAVPPASRDPETV